jgi:RND family efflux transporter MFP subunit
VVYLPMTTSDGMLPMKSTGVKILPLLVFVIGAVAVLGWMIVHQFKSTSGKGQGAVTARPLPVEVKVIRRGSIALHRTFSGELKAQAEFVVAPKVSGRVLQVMVNLADRVARGQIVAELDNDEYVQAVAQAGADLEVARANLSQAKSALEIAEREFKRTESLLGRGIASDSEYDAARQDQMAKNAQLKVAAAQVAKAESSLETTNIRLGYTKVTAGWTGGDEYRVVAERYVDEGQTVTANAPLLTIVELNPIVGIFFVTEKEYAYLHPGQPVSLTTEAFPGEPFSGRIERIAPVFRKSTRQARVEMHIDNPQHRLKPGMFIRVSVELARVADAVIIPQQALTVRDDQEGIFIVSGDGRSVAWHPVTVGIVDGDQVQAQGDGLTGEVVTLGQQLLSDGALITIPQQAASPAGDRQGIGQP